MSRINYTYPEKENKLSLFHYEKIAERVLFMKMIGQGNTSEVYEYEEKKVLKLFREGIPKEIIMKEYEIALFIQKHLKNVPKAYSVIQIDNRYGIIYDRLNGNDMIEKILHALTKTTSFVKTFTNVHIDLHKHSVSTEMIPSVKDKLIDEIKLVHELSEEKKEALIAYINTLPDGNTLCHFDFHPGNVIWEENSVMVIDWMTACFGDPSADIARTYLLLCYGELPHETFWKRWIIKCFQKHIFKVYLREYQRGTGIKWDDIEKWIVPVAAARLHEWIPEREKRALLSLIA